MSWGKWIIVSFILFAAFIATLVTVCIRANFSLVSKDYYRQELEFQDQIVRVQNTASLESKPEIEAIDGKIAIRFNLLHKLEKGELTMFRPSDEAFDKTFTLTHSNTNTQEFSTDTLKSGMYRARMQWTMDGKEYYYEQIVYI